MMKLCASPGTPCIDGTENADLIEIRTDVFSDIPEIDKEMIITLTDPLHIDMVPKDFGGMLDVGTSNVERNDLRIISSFHDPGGVPDSALNTLHNLSGDIVKGAFFINDLKDLMKIYNISTNIERKHVLIGMGELGKITRIRQELLGNSFTFCHTGTPTAPGQMSVNEMLSVTDDTMITGLVCQHISNSSQKMHDAAFKDLNIDGKYLLFDVFDIERIKDVMVAYNIRGLNITHPFKEMIIEHLDSLDTISKDTGSVNTVVNDNKKLKGFNTDIQGIRTSMEMAGIVPSNERALIIGSGGAARSCTYFMTKTERDVTVMGRNTKKLKSLSNEFGCRTIPYGSAALKMYDIIINCTPETDLKIGLEGLTKDQAVFDMIHNSDTSLLNVAKKKGCSIVDAKNMLAVQGAASFELWTGAQPKFNVMRNAV